MICSTYFSLKMTFCDGCTQPGCSARLELARGPTFLVNALVSRRDGAARGLPTDQAKRRSADLRAGHCDPHRQIMNTEHQGIFSMYCILIVVEVKFFGKLRLLQLGQQIIWTQQEYRFHYFFYQVTYYDCMKNVVTFVTFGSVLIMA